MLILKVLPDKVTYCWITCCTFSPGVRYAQPGSPLRSDFFPLYFVLFPLYFCLLYFLPRRSLCSAGVFASLRLFTLTLVFLSQAFGFASTFLLCTFSFVLFPPAFAMLSRGLRFAPTFFLLYFFLCTFSFVLLSFILYENHAGKQHAFGHHNLI